MIKTVKIENYKSVHDLTLELGSINVFIGENGCGKTNILEAIALGAAAAAGKLDNEFLSVRGVRVTEPEWMKSAFDKEESQKLPIKISCEYLDNNFHHVELDTDEKGGLVSIINNSPLEKFKEAAINSFSKDLKIKDNDLTDIERVMIILNTLQESLKAVAVIMQSGTEKLKFSKKIKGPVKRLFETILNQPEYINAFENQEIYTQFLLYCPENFFLRRFEEESQIRPLGIRGEGLFKHLVELFKNKKELFDKVKEHLQLIDWFDDFEIPNDLMFTERRINIKDRYIDADMNYFDQRSANEGFLYMLFYFVLFISEKTPSFFAIDNIDNSLNPKLCNRLIQSLFELSKEHKKQAILTTHNPAILDGLDLKNDQQRLFVIYRNADGHTTAKRVLPPKTVEGVEPVRLSEAFIRGYLGGLPTNF